MSTKNKNLFYQLYSTPNDITNSGFSCSSAIDENDTSFDISGDKAVITDSNGNKLAEIDLKPIHSEGLTEYKSETKVLAPYSSYMIQGSEYGETYGTYFFKIPQQITKFDNYNSYINAEFDIKYIYNFEVYNIHISTYHYRKCPCDFICLIQQMLDKIQCHVSVSIHCENGSEYIVFQGQSEGYFFEVRNLALFPIKPTDSNCDGTDGNYYDSPFIGANIDTDFIQDMLVEYQPRTWEEINYEKDYGQKQNDKDVYSIDCGVYKEMLKIASIVNTDFSKFCDMIDALKLFSVCFDERGNIIDHDKFEELAARYEWVYDIFFDKSSELSKYSIFDLLEMFDGIRLYVFENQVPKCFFIEADDELSVPYIKYPYGAMRGLVVVPDFPSSDEFESSVIYLNHVPSHINMPMPFDPKQLEEHIGKFDYSSLPTNLCIWTKAEVHINDIDKNEKHQFEVNPKYHLSDFGVNGEIRETLNDRTAQAMDFKQFLELQFTRNQPINGKKKPFDISKGEPMWIEGKDLEHMNIYHPQHQNVKVGLYGYMKYLNDNDLWTKIGDAYMICGKKDNEQSKVKNLLNSVIIYNPNSVPIRIKYMVFS